ncbi:hypothetical protein Q3G72_035635 [Acer saccharum]|nr:hypothetical protein Q3G72_035635 [Acer saccharum]
MNSKKPIFDFVFILLRSLDLCFGVVGSHENVIFELVWLRNGCHLVGLDPGIHLQRNGSAGGRRRLTRVSHAPAAAPRARVFTRPRVFFQACVAHARPSSVSACFARQCPLLLMSCLCSSWAMSC